ncbi:MAG: ACP S-malonyltransferase [Defluviitaleaceae bacterium]|nr:ACP S-malonyltransferase [Defluviitaleaceae bacterium]
MDVIMFSGQGAQKAGMGKAFYDEFAVCRQVFEEASDALGLDITKLCFEDADKQLALTQFAQPALVTAGIAMYRAYEQEGGKSGLLMGLSLGEYTALAAAEVLGFADTVKLVHKRGLLMAEFAKPGGMVAVMNLDRAVVEEICKSAPEGFVAPANFNTPGQIVISGEKVALDYCASKVKEAGGKAMPLKVAGPFHTPLMDVPAEKLREEATGITVKCGTLPIISNVNGNTLTYEDLAGHMATHMISPVSWTTSVMRAVDLGGSRFIEMGVGETLVNFVKKIDDSVETFALSVESLK